MMEHNNTQATNAHNLWRQGLRELALKQARERGMSRPQARDFGKTLHGMWQHLVLQGWNQIFTPPPPSKDMGAQQNPADEAPSEEIDDREFGAPSFVEGAENNQEIWAPFKGSSEIKRSEEAQEKQETDTHSAAGTEEWERPQWMKCGTETPARDHRGAWETFFKGSEMEEEEEQEKRENKDEIVSFSKQGTKVWERSQLMKCGTEITPEAPILRTELLRDDLILKEKEFPSSGREAKTEPEARTFIEQNQEREHFFEREHYRESSIYQMDGHPFIGQDLLPEAPIISPGAKEMENSFDDEDLRKKPPGEKMLGEGQRSFLKDDGYHEQVPKMRVPAQARDYPSNSQNWPTKAPEIERLDEIEERLFGNEGQSNFQTEEYLSGEERLLEARGIKGLNEGKERPFGDEDRHKEAPETKMRDESRQSLIDDESQPKEVLNKGRRRLSIDQDRLKTGTRKR